MTLGRDLLELRLGRHAADRRDEVGDREPQIGDHAEVDRRAAGEARRIEPDRDQPRARRGALAVLVAEVEQHVGLARDSACRAAAARRRADAGSGTAATSSRAPAHWPATGRPSSSASSSSSLLGAAPGDLVADADERVACASISARAAFSTSSLSGRMRIGTSNLAWSQICGLGLTAQRVGRQREEHRAAGRGRGELHAAPSRLRDRLRRLRLPVPLGDRLRHAPRRGRISCVRSRPSASCSTEATATRIGIWSFQLLTIWVMALGRPILATMTTPVLPEARA